MLDLDLSLVKSTGNLILIANCSAWGRSVVNYNFSPKRQSKRLSSQLSLWWLQSATQENTGIRCLPSLWPSKPACITSAFFLLLHSHSTSWLVLSFTLHVPAFLVSTWCSSTLALPSSDKVHGKDWRWTQYWFSKTQRFYMKESHCSSLDMAKQLPTGASGKTLDSFTFSRFPSTSKHILETRNDISNPLHGLLNFLTSSHQHSPIVIIFNLVYHKSLISCQSHLVGVMLALNQLIF